VADALLRGGPQAVVTFTDNGHLRSWVELDHKGILEALTIAQFVHVTVNPGPIGVISRHT
jgi:hypothetical protein